MAIQETPINYKTYYKLMQNRTKERLNSSIENREKLIKQLASSKENIVKNYDTYKNNFNINLNDYKEFEENIYIDGKFYKVAKGLFINRGNNYELVSDLFDLYNHAQLQKKLYDINNEIKKCNKLLSLKISEYNNILRVYYTEVHKKLVIEGNGYVFDENIGWICVNRCVLIRPKKMIDYAATKKREKELKEQGKRIYNKEEADWCLRNGIEYKAEDKRVFRNDEYCYEIPLLNSKLPNGSKLRLEISDYRHKCVRGKTNEDLIKECNNDINLICKLPVDLKTKVTLCDKVDKILYTKYIRNENQEAYNVRKTNRKNRQ